MSIASASNVITGTGSIKLTVIGYGRTSAGDVIANRRFSCDQPGDGVGVLVPEVAGDLLVSVTDIRLPASWANGTAIISVNPPEGRDLS